MQERHWAGFGAVARSLSSRAPLPAADRHQDGGGNQAPRSSQEARLSTSPHGGPQSGGFRGRMSVRYAGRPGACSCQQL